MKLEMGTGGMVIVNFELIMLGVPHKNGKISPKCAHLKLWGKDEIEKTFLIITICTIVARWHLGRPESAKSGI